MGGYSSKISIKNDPKNNLKFENEYQIHKNLKSKFTASTSAGLTGGFELNLNDTIIGEIGLLRYLNRNSLQLALGLHKSEMFHSKFTVSYPILPSEKNMNFILDTAIPIRDKINLGFRLNTDMNLDYFKQDKYKLDTAIAYTKRRTKIILRSSHNILSGTMANHIIGLTLYNQFTKYTECALDIQRNISSPAPSIQLGANTKLDTLSSFKARALIKPISVDTDSNVDSDCRIGLSYFTQISKHAKCIFSVDLGLRNLLGNQNYESHYFGLDINLTT